MAVGDILSIGIDGWWVTAVAPSAPTLIVVNDGDGDAVTVTIDGDVGVTTYVYYRDADDDSWTLGGSVIGDGDVAIDGLEDGHTYYFYAQSELGGIYSAISSVIIGVVASTGSSDTIAEAGTSAFDVMIEDLTKLGMYDNATKRPVSWYKKIRTASKPPQDVMAGVSVSGASHDVLDHPTASVHDNPTLFTNMGQIYMMIQRVRPKGLSVRRNMEVETGEYRGTCSPKFNVTIGDHIIDFDGNEYRVLVADKDLARTFVSCQLTLIPRRGF